jgi:hypothetical protein
VVGVNVRSLPASPRRKPIAALVVAAFVFAWLLAVRAPVAHAECPVLDLACTVDETSEAVDDAAQGTVDAVEGTVETVEGVVDDAVDAVENTVENVTDAVDDVLGTVDDTVDDVIDDVVGEPDDATPTPPEEEVAGEAPASGDGRTGSGDPAATGGAPDRGPPNVEGRPAADHLASAFGDAAGGGPDAGAAAAIRSAPSDAPGVGGFDAGALAATVAFPAVIALAVATFLAIQNRLDRRDPKLAIAPVGPDVVAFA